MHVLLKLFTAIHPVLAGCTLPHDLAWFSELFGDQKAERKVSVPSLVEMVPITPPPAPSGTVAVEMPEYGPSNEALLGAEKEREKREREKEKMERERLLEEKPIEKKKKEVLRREIEMDEHLVPLEKLVARLGTHEKNGLMSSQIPELIQKYGKNSLSPPKEVPAILKYAKHLFTGENANRETERERKCANVCACD